MFGPGVWGGEHWELGRRWLGGWGGVRGAQFEVSGWGEVLGPAGSGVGGEWWELGRWGIITVDTYCLLHIPPAFLHVLGVESVTPNAVGHSVVIMLKD